MITLLDTQANDTQIAEMVNLVNGADSVELKVTVPDTDHRSAVTALNMDVLDAEVRQVVFFDTADLKLNRNGVVVRARFLLNFILS
jgi:ACT domain-containing protein